MSLPHWLDDIIALVKREGERWTQGNPDKAAHHATAAAALEALRDSGVSHEDAKAQLANLDDDEDVTVEDPSSVPVNEPSVELPTAPVDVVASTPDQPPDQPDTH